MKRLKRIVSTMLAVIMLITMLPQMQLVNVNAATLTATASVPYLGHTNNPIKIGAKQQDEKWVQTVLKEGKKAYYVFCLGLGKTCRTGDTFSYNYTTGTDSWETYSSESTNETRALYAKIGYWYYNNQTKKSWIYAQALIWVVTEGEASKAGLTNVIKSLNDDPVIYGSTSYKSTQTVANLYSEIFDVKVSIKAKMNYRGITYTDDLTKNGAEQLAEVDLILILSANFIIFSIMDNRILLYLLIMTVIYVVKTQKNVLYCRVILYIKIRTKKFCSVSIMLTVENDII